VPIGFEQPDSGGTSSPDEEKDRWAWADAIAGLVIPVIWTRWVTREDERVCPECGPLDGLVWPEDNGPSTPLHNNCRCDRLYAFTTFRVRPSAN
jgi:hypothetical protein